MRRPRSHTRWSDPLLARHWDRLRDVVGEAWLPCLRSAPGKRLRARRLGEGTYGLVLPTQDPEVVLKATTDAREVAFVLRAQKLDRWPDGLVRYHRILDTEESARRLGRVFLLWRERAERVGSVMGAWRDPGGPTRRECLRFSQLLALYDELIDPVWCDVTGPRIIPWRCRAVARFAQAQLRRRFWRELPMDCLEEVLDAVIRSGRRSLFREHGCAVAAARAVARAMEQGNWGSEVGTALGYYLDHGLLLTDAHEGNLGLVQRYGRTVVAIIDPSNVLPLTRRADRKPRVERLSRARTAADPGYAAAEAFAGS